ncbi:MAG: bifunctional DNA-formamidopyrimidine glycosylase/DNA-(apurinic or apyrimidinic site) lyase [Phycisphaerales bacterium JB059]
MPELPEVESVRRTLDERLVGRRVEAARLFRRDVLVCPGDPLGGFARSGQAPPDTRVPLRRLLRGEVIASTERLGKQLALVGDSGNVMLVHLGMSGQLLLTDRPASAHDHVHAAWTFDRGERLLFRDPRRFGGLWSFPGLEALRAARWDALGPDALTLRGADLAQRLARTRRPVKAVLLDQRAVAGVGNIYADEALFAASIDPARPADRLSPDEARDLARAIRRILRQAIRAGGSTLRDYRTPAGARGSFQLRHRVYARSGLPCRRCGETLESLTLAQRTTVRCPSCQR